MPYILQMFIFQFHFRCDCATGELSPPQNGNKCDTVSEYLVFSTRTEIRSIHLDPKETSVPFRPVVSVCCGFPTFSQGSN